MKDKPDVLSEKYYIRTKRMFSSFSIIFTSTAVIGVLYGLITGVVFKDLPIHIVVLPYFLLVMGGIFGTRVETLKENYKLYNLIKGERQE